VEDVELTEKDVVVDEEHFSKELVAYLKKEDK